MTPPADQSSTPPDPAAPSLARVPHPALSLWESSVRQVVATHVAQGDINAEAVYRHPLVRAAESNAADQAALKQDLRVPGLEEVRGKQNLFDIALAHAHALVHGAGDFAGSIGTFDDLDPLFLGCVFEFVNYYWLSHRRPQYRDWSVSSAGLAFSVVDDIPPGGKVAIIGDWGTGLSDAGFLLEQLLVSQRPDVLVHLGDVYYSGTPAEMQHNFMEPLARVLREHAELGTGPRVYAIPGNHDYYCGGGGFYGLIDGLNSGSSRQSASYFCLRTSDQAYQLLGMDTGYGDREPGILFDKSYMAPMPQDSEIVWLHDKLDRFPGQTILFSHNQPFSSHSPLNGPESGLSPDVNQRLLDMLGNRLRSVVAWFWGHEHNLVLFDDDQHGVAKGRLVGCSAFETAPDDDPYGVKFPAVGMQAVRLGKTGDWYNHGCAVVDLRAQTIAYFQSPAWLGDAPSGTPALTQLAEEPLHS